MPLGKENCVELTISGHEAEDENLIASSWVEEVVAVFSKCTFEVLPKSLMRPTAVVAISCAHAVLSGLEEVIIEPVPVM